MKARTMAERQWLRLDNAAKIYPPVVTNRTTSVFRLSVTLRNNVDSNLLQDAVDVLGERFPYFSMRLKAGLFWYYLEGTGQTPLVQHEYTHPCRAFSKRKDQGFLFRVLYFQSKISVEFSHCMTDGTGALLYLKTLVTEYLKIKERVSADGETSFDVDSSLLKEELEDSYVRYYKKNIPYPDLKVNAFHMPGRCLPAEYYLIITGILPVDEVKKASKKYAASITEFLTAVYFYAFQQYVAGLPPRQRKKLCNPVRLHIPVNLRNLYPSQTIRNFFLSVRPEIDIRLGEYSLEEIISIVHHYMRAEVNEKYINQQIARNVAGEKNLFVRLIPLFLKIPIQKILYRVFSLSKHTSLLTNLGVVAMPEACNEYIERFEFIPNPEKATKIGCGIISYNEHIYISFGSLIENRDVQRIFFTTLREMDIPVQVETNFNY